MKIDVLGVGIDGAPRNEVLVSIRSRLAKGEKLFLATPYSESIVAAQKDEKFRQILNSADIALPDGIGILWAAKFLNTPPPHAWGGQGRGRWFWLVGELLKSLLAIIFFPRYIRNPIPEKISGAEFVYDLARLAEEKQYRIFFCGGFADTPKRAADKLLTSFPSLKVSGWFNGSPNDPELVRAISSAGTDFLFVAFGPQVQEIWINRHLEKLDIKLAIGLGGTLDYLAGRRPYRPKFWAQRGGEWLWRLLTQPWRVVRVTRGVLGLIYLSFKFRLRKI